LSFYVTFALPNAGRHLQTRLERRVSLLCKCDDGVLLCFPGLAAGWFVNGCRSGRRPSLPSGHEGPFVCLFVGPSSHPTPQRGARTSTFPSPRLRHVLARTLRTLSAPPARRGLARHPARRRGGQSVIFTRHTAPNKHQTGAAEAECGRLTDKRKSRPPAPGVGAPHWRDSQDMIIRAGSAGAQPSPPSCLGTCAIGRSIKVSRARVVCEGSQVTPCPPLCFARHTHTHTHTTPAGPRQLDFPRFACPTLSLTPRPRSSRISVPSGPQPAQSTKHKPNQPSSLPPFVLRTCIPKIMVEVVVSTVVARLHSFGARHTHTKSHPSPMAIRPPPRRRETLRTSVRITRGPSSLSFSPTPHSVILFRAFRHRSPTATAAEAASSRATSSGPVCATLSDGGDGGRGRLD
jgi:hypothetical protein